MKKILLSALFLGATNIMSAQCTTTENGQFPDKTFIPSCQGEFEKLTDMAFTSEYSVVQLTEGITYNFINRKADGSTYLYVIITSEDGNEIIAHNEGQVTWTADSTRKVRFYSQISATSCTTDWGADMFDRVITCEATATDYCKPTLDCSNGAVIKNISISDFNNSSECSENGYNDFSSKIITIEKEKNHDLNVEIGFGWYEQSVSMWIDYNKNFLFEENEYTYIGQQNNGAGTVSKTITIPKSIADGEYRMRIRLATTPERNATWNKSCDIADSYGETEDYTLKIVTELATDDIQKAKINISPNPVTDYLNISSNNEVAEITVTNTNGQVVKRFRPASKIDLKSLTPGLYIINIKQKDGQSVSRKIIKK